MSVAKVNDDFKCNLFENTPYDEILSAVNTLNQAVNSPNCGNKSVDVQGIVDNNNKIASAVKALKGYIDNPASATSDKAADIVNTVDVAIQAANGVASTFAQNDLSNSQCRQKMSAGQIALALNNVVNGLTPYALMAAQFTGGTAAIPFIVGGSVITGAISSMAKIIDQNTVDTSDPQVRQAIVENTCQFIRLDQKYKFITKSRQEQIQKITAEISSSQKLFSAKIQGFSAQTNNMVNRKNYLDQTALDLNNKLGSAHSQLDLDKQFLAGTTDTIKICQLGIQLATMSQDKTSYVSTMLGSLDEAMQAYGTTSIAQVQALKASAKIAIQDLTSMAQKQFSINANFDSCAKVTQSLVGTIDQSGNLSKQLVKIAQTDIEKQLKGSSQYSLFQQRMTVLTQKQVQAERLTDSLDNLKRYATSLAQSEIDSEMDRLRRGLLAPRAMGFSSPVVKWFTFVQGLHRGAVTQFNNGLNSLRDRAYRLTASGKSSATQSWLGAVMGNMPNAKDKDDGYQMRTFDLKTLPLGTQEHDATCREMQDVWNRWVTAVDHLAAMDAFCNMIEPYVYDSRSEDRDLVVICRGYTVASGGSAGASMSTLASLKTQLVQNHTRDWALYLKKKIDAMACIDTNSLN